ncbi:hypothetical protein [Streptomyces sp. RB17]|nr:hypothetical protein [Streptomyces sp. RB17]
MPDADLAAEVRRVVALLRTKSPTVLRPAAFSDGRRPRFAQS